MKSGFDYKEYSKWVENLGIAKSDFRLWLKQFLLKEAQRVVAKAKRRTPVDTGFLRNAYGIGTQKLAFKTASNNYNIKLDTEKSDIASIKVIITIIIILFSFFTSTLLSVILLKSIISISSDKSRYLINSVYSGEFIILFISFNLLFSILYFKS